VGDIIGGIIGGVGSLLGGSKQSKADSQASQQSLTGFNYLTGQNGVQSYVNSGNQANSTASALLTGGPNSAAANSAYNNYLNSTGYNFQLQQGQQAITGSAAARGLLGSGGTAKALTQFGQGLAGNYFNNYLAQLGGVSNQGLQASGQIGSAGTFGGGNAAGYTQAGGAAQASTITGGLGGLSAAIGGATNYFGL
jgi:hypothetical protein